MNELDDDTAEQAPTAYDVIALAIDRGSRLLGSFAKYGTWAYASYCAWQAIASLAGKKTDATIALFINSLENNPGYTCLAFLAFGIVGICYGVLQNITKERTVRRLHPRIKQLELLLDERRTSSNLLPNGRTNPDDE